LTVVLPLTLATSPDEPNRPKVADLLTTQRIVFVDNEPNLLAGLRRMLRIKRDVWDMHGPVPVDQEVVADVVPPQAEHVVSVEAADDGRDLAAGVVVRGVGVVHEDDDDRAGAQRCRPAQTLVGLPARTADDHGKRDSGRRRGTGWWGGREGETVAVAGGVVCVVGLSALVERAAAIAVGAVAGADVVTVVGSDEAVGLVAAATLEAAGGT
jgi:hypothetical protein